MTTENKQNFRTGRVKKAKDAPKTFEQMPEEERGKLLARLIEMILSWDEPKETAKSEDTGETSGTGK